MAKFDSKLDAIEESTGTLKSQMKEVLGRTLHLEKQVQINVSEIEAIKNDLVSLKQTVAQQQKTISQLQQSHKAKDSQTQDKISTIKKSLENQEKKTEQLYSLRHKIKSDVDAKLQSHDQQAKHDAQKAQAYSNRHNLVIMGLPENNRSNPRSQATQFFKDQLKLDKLAINSVYRIGKPPPQGSPYARPISVKFSDMVDRNTVWRRRKEIRQDEHGNLPRIQPDLPKQL